LDTVYGIEDLHDLIEIVVIDGHNREIAAQPQD
jgi:hypothetical protein